LYIGVTLMIGTPHVWQKYLRQRLVSTIGASDG
jgi:hypothetical protein